MSKEFTAYEYGLLVECSEKDSKMGININATTGEVTAFNKVNKSVVWKFGKGVELIEKLLLLCQISPNIVS